MYKKLLVLILVALTNSCWAQEKENLKVSTDSIGKNDTLPATTLNDSLLSNIDLLTNNEIKLSEWKQTFNRYFGSVLGSVGSNNEIGSFASFDPIDGNFKFKGTLPIGEKNKKLNFLTLSIQGGILSNNVSQLFKNSKINTNSEVQGEYHMFMRVNRSFTNSSLEKQATLSLKQYLIEQKASIKLAKTADYPVEQLRKIKILEQQGELMKLQQKYDDNQVQTNRTKIQNLLDNPLILNKVNIDLLEITNKELKKIINQYDSLDKAIDKNKIEVDSLNGVVALWLELNGDIDNQSIKDQDDQIDTLRSKFIFNRYALNWWTLVGGIGKKNFSVYDSKLPFDSQLIDDSFITHRYGLAWNLFIKNNSSSKSWLLNVGVLNMKENNLKLLTTTDINQETVIKNEAGDVTRKIAKKYAAYTDKIESYRQLLIYSNAYFLSGSTASGFHIFPSYYKPKKTGYLNFGLGYIASFKNTKKDSPVINAELYVDFNDLFNSLDLGKKFINRNEIGVRFTLPFNFFI